MGMSGYHHTATDFTPCEMVPGAHCLGG